MFSLAAVAGAKTAAVREEGGRGGLQADDE